MAKQTIMLLTVFWKRLIYDLTNIHDAREIDIYVSTFTKYARDAYWILFKLATYLALRKYIKEANNTIKFYLGKICK